MCCQRGHPFSAAAGSWGLTVGTTNGTPHPWNHVTIGGYHARNATTGHSPLQGNAGIGHVRRCACGTAEMALSFTLTDTCHALHMAWPKCHGMQPSSVALIHLCCCICYMYRWICCTIWPHGPTVGCQRMAAVDAHQPCNQTYCLSIHSLMVAVRTA